MRKKRVGSPQRSGDTDPPLGTGWQKCKIVVEGLTGTLTWNDEGQVEKPATAYVIKDGKYVQA